MLITKSHNKLLAAVTLCLPLLFAQHASANRPYSGSLPNMPGVIEAENYDFDGQGDAYNDATVGNTGGAYRSDYVDLEAAAGGGYNIGWFDPGEWVEYSVNVPTAGVYTLTARVATTGSGTLHYEFYGATRVDSANVSFGSSGGWQNWVNSPSVSVTLNAGAHVIRLSQMGGGFNVNSFTVAQQNTPPANLPTAYSGYTGVYPGYTLKLDDRFDSFNTNVWKKGDGAVGGESICRFTPQGVNVVNGNLELVVRSEYVAGSWSYDHNADKGAYNYSCGELRTLSTKRIKYGRIETRMKAPARAVAKGYISSLFTYVQEGSPKEWEEIDIELEGSRPDMFQANLIYGVNVADWSGTRQWGAWEHKISIAPADAWSIPP